MGCGVGCCVVEEEEEEAVVVEAVTELESSPPTPTPTPQHQHKHETSRLRGVKLLTLARRAMVVLVASKIPTATSSHMSSHSNMCSITAIARSSRCARVSRVLVVVGCWWWSGAGVAGARRSLAFAG